MRKTVLTGLALVGFVLTMLISPTIDPFQLGLGLGFLLSPHAAANAMEHKFKNNK